MAKKLRSNNSNQGEHSPLGAIEKIGQLMHWKFTLHQLKMIRDLVVGTCHRDWNKKSFLGKAMIYHWQEAKLTSPTIHYHHLLLAELIRNFSIASKEEYLEKCKEFRIYPFFDKKRVKNPPSGSEAMSSKDFVKVIKEAMDAIKNEINSERQAEVEHAINQPYPICSFDELMNKKNLN